MKIINKTLPYLDKFIYFLIYIPLYFFKKIRKIGVHRFPYCKNLFFKLGVFPIIDHYYEPLFCTDNLKHSLSESRVLPGINWNINEQLFLLSDLRYSHELLDSPQKKQNDHSFYLDNPSFKSGDAEYWYNLIRLKKPSKIIEIGSGYSTLLAIKAIHNNKNEYIKYNCEHICIEPYEKKWLEDLGISVIREKVEDLDIELFLKLTQGDILFIDSSHIIRPQGDVLFELLTLLPQLKKGVIVHIHDIFSPRDYLDQWVKNEVKFWNEQYLLEAFLTSNKDWKIIGSLNHLHHQHYDQLKEVCPYLTKDREPGSFYIQKIS